MSKIYYERLKICEEVELEIEKMLGINFDDYYFDYITLEKNNNNDVSEEKYQVLLNIFHCAFSLGEKGKIYLWKALNRNTYGEFPYNAEDFSDEEIEFLKTASAVVSNAFEHPNVNPPLLTDRLELAPFKCIEDNQKLKQALIANGTSEYEMYTGMEYTPREERHFFNDYPLIFGIYLKGEIIGTIGLENICSNDERYNLEFYILPEYRCKGYLSEALDRLLKAAFENELVVQQETIYANKYENCHPTINVIVISTREDNIPCNHVAQKYGASFDGRVRYNHKIGSQYIDSMLYTLVNPNWKR